ncbi:MAG: hypothetical protein LKF42_09490 [Streptococcaceae bacterium]|nr:hypothetical protein [Streptococcaceae bacterium]MCH4178095.1 hypothetical protein [Streptococcaceae bacterium]
MRKFDLLKVLVSLEHKRKIFHSEADFQFALAWEIKISYPTAEIRLEYAPEIEPYKYIDILVEYLGDCYPIELKYKTKKFKTNIGSELFILKNHGAQDLGKYDFIKDISRIESFSGHLPRFKKGYVIWLTNDPSYWNPPKKSEAIYKEFSVHDGVIKNGVMQWIGTPSIGTIKNREKCIELFGTYQVSWMKYSDLGVKDGLFHFAMISIENEDSLNRQKDWQKI